MLQAIFIYPFYNAFVFLIGVTGGDAGLAIITMTIALRAIFYPAFSASIRTQMGMQKVQGELDEINKKYKDNADERAKHTMELFKKHEVRPFAGLVALIIQIPIFFSMYYAFLREGFPHIVSGVLYSFVHAPAAVNVEFLGILNLVNAHNLPLAVTVAALQYAVVRFSLGRIKPASPLSSEKAQAQAMQQNMMLYAMPVLYAVITYSFPAVAGLYFATGNVISLAQEGLIRRELKGKK